MRSLRNMLVRSGPAHALFSKVTAAMPKIFMYHRFSAAAEPRKTSAQAFDAHLDFLARRYRLMCMGDLVEEVRASGRVPRGVAVITVDDAYQDFFDVAYPRLKARGIPATVFVASGFADGAIWLWPDQLQYAIFNTRKEQLVLPDGHTVELKSPDSRWTAWSRTGRFCLGSPDEVRVQTMRDIFEQTEVDVPATPTPDFAGMSWPEITAVRDSGIEIGGHTRTHPVLSQVSSARLTNEISGCKADLEQRLDTEIVSFCYPNGEPRDITAAAKDAVKAAGFTSAVAAYAGPKPMQDLYEINRLSASSNLEEFVLAASGITHCADTVRAYLPRQRLGAA